MEHHHDHTHSNSVPSNATKAFVIGIILNSVFVVVEAAAGLFTHSLSLLADAGHNLSDVGSLALALFANKLAMKKANEKFSFGYRQSTVLVAFLNGCILLIAMGAIAYEAIINISKPHTIEGGFVAVIAGIGIVVNGATAFLFMKDKEKDLNVKGAYLHMASDALVSLGVVIAGVIILFTSWFWLDSVISLIIVVVILLSSWGLLKDSLRLTLNGVPEHIKLADVQDYFSELPGVTNVHDLHVWAISTTETALTVHLVMPDATQNDAIYAMVKETLHHRFQIAHSTIQIETNSETFSCGQRSIARNHI